MWGHDGCSYDVWAMMAAAMMCGAMIAAAIVPARLPRTARSDAYGSDGLMTWGVRGIRYGATGGGGPYLWGLGMEATDGH